MQPKILIVSDHPALATGFGRVHREIGLGLAKAGFGVYSLGWFYQPVDAFVPWPVFVTDQEKKNWEKDKYGELTYDKVVARVKPDLTLAIGDYWMVNHLAERPRNHVFVGYTPIDGRPLNFKWAAGYRHFDHLVLFGEFGQKAVQSLLPDLSTITIPHGVDLETFHPLSEPERHRARQELGMDATNFVVGCVARNSRRKNLPRLLRAFRDFVAPWTACQQCGRMYFQTVEQCGCGASGEQLRQGSGKDSARLYLHTCAQDPTGYDLLPLIVRYDLMGKVGLPDSMRPGDGVSEAMLNRIYNAMDVFTLPTTAEGWCLPAIESMACRVPVLITNYSGHLDFVKGAAELIEVSEFEVDKDTLADRALVDLMDYVIKLDRMYYSPEAFLRKWGMALRSTGLSDEQLQQVPTGYVFRQQLAEMGYQRAQQYPWKNIVQTWVEQIGQWVAGAPKQAPIFLEVL